MGLNPDLKPDRNSSELAWFGSGKFPSDWASEQLIQVLEAGGGVSFDYTVTQRLREMAATDLMYALRIVSLLADRACSPHLILSGRDQPRAVLSAALDQATSRSSQKHERRLAALR